MSDWTSYELVDFLMFSPTTYYRMVALYHGWLWPLHLLIVVAIIVLIIKRHLSVGKLTVLLFALAWLFVGVAFFHYQFAPIFWAAYYIAPIFAAQALLLVVTVFSKRVFIEGPQLIWKAPTYILVAVALIVPLLSTITSGRSLATSDLVFVTPDPTVVATFSLLCAFRSPWWLFPVPILWSAFSGLLLYAMESPWFWVVPLSALFAIIVRLLPHKIEPAAE